MIKPIVKVIEVPLDASTAYKLFTAGMGLWWPLDTRSITAHSEGVPAKALETDAMTGGAIIEIGEDDTRHVWGNFKECDPPNSVAIDFHMGQPKENATHIMVSFLPLEEKQTLVKLTHGGWASYGAMAEFMRDGYDSGWDEIFGQHFAKACQRRH